MCTFLFPLLLHFCLAEYYTYGSPELRTCSADSDCDTAGGEICHMKYIGCTKGQCMCRPGTDIYDNQLRKCVKERVYGKPCDGSRDSCRDPYECRNGRCYCPQHKQPTPDGQFCFSLNQRFLGEECTGGRVADSDTCYRKLDGYGYSTSGVTCYGGYCRCTSGLRPSGKKCRRYKIGEEGCRDNVQCGGGALCKDRRCVCPAGMTVIHGGSRCAPTSAQFNVPFGKHCDERGRSRYCARGLLCHQCPEETTSKCVRYAASRAGTLVYLQHSLVISTIFTMLAS